jgi:hypothetical protein
LHTSELGGLVWKTYSILEKFFWCRVRNFLQQRLLCVERRGGKRRSEMKSSGDFEAVNENSSGRTVLN